MDKVETEYLKYFWPMRHYLVSCGTSEKANIIAVSFCMPVSKDPPMVACAIGGSTYSRELIQATGEFVVNVPTKDLTRQIYYCGYHSGRNDDKFRETGLTPFPARQISVPIIAECVAHMECCVVQTVPSGDKVIFVAEVADAYADVALEQRRHIFNPAEGSFPEKVYGTRFSLRGGHERALF